MADVYGSGLVLLAALVVQGATVVCARLVACAQPHFALFACPPVRAVCTALRCHNSQGLRLRFAATADTAESDDWKWYDDHNWRWYGLAILVGLADACFQSQFYTITGAVSQPIPHREHSYVVWCGERPCACYSESA
eukprot:COSAG01_NODE_3719_length_5763_cov_6.742323_3_plen_137_part_00